MSDQEMLAKVPDAPKKQQAAIGSRGDVSWKRYSNHWKDNHGTPLMVFAGLIFALGSGLIYYQQNRFRPVEFPSGESIQNVEPNPVSASSEIETLEDADPAISKTADPANVSGKAVVQVTGATNAKGRIRIAIYSSADHFNDPQKADWKGDFAVNAEGDTRCVVQLKGLADRFAIAAYHDENNNRQLDRNALGIPTEKYGFSNDARGKLGPPAFDDAVMNQPETDQPIELKIR